jgi:hypothetical protein
MEDVNWRRGFGTISDEDGKRLAGIVAEQRDRTGSGLAVRQKRVIDALIDGIEDRSSSS